MLRMAQLPLIGAALAGVVAVGGCTPEPHVTPEPLYLTPSSHCFTSIATLALDRTPESVSTDLLVVDVDALSEARAEVVGRSPCTSFDVAGDLVSLQLRAIASILDLLSNLPELSANHRYGLVGGVYFDDPDCSAGGGEPIACGMSGAFGDVDAPASDPDAGPDAGVDRLQYFLLCPATEACLRQSDCTDGTCDIGSGICARDEQCQSGTCGEDGACDGGVCRSADGQECLALRCSGNAVCTGADCASPDGSPCVPGSCQDYVEGEELAPLYPVGYPYCTVLYDDATSSD